MTVCERSSAPAPSTVTAPSLAPASPSPFSVGGCPAGGSPSRHHSPTTAPGPSRTHGRTTAVAATWRSAPTRDHHLDLLAALVQRLLGSLQRGHHPDPVPAVGARLGPGGAAVQEMLQLQGQRLGQVGAWHVDIAGAHPELVLAEAALHRVGTFVVDP